MKKYTLTALILLATSIGFSQKKLTPKELTPARGHYKQLSVFSPKPKSTSEEIDKEKFQTDKETVERRMSLKPNYLQNVTVEDFKIPDPPANSSQQTRMEINYLLALQKYRSKEDILSSLYMAN